MNPMNDPHVNSWRLLEQYNYSSQYETITQQTNQLTNDQFVATDLQHVPVYSKNFSREKITQVDAIKHLINNGWLAQATKACNELRKKYPMDSDLDGNIGALENRITSATTWKKMMATEKNPAKLAEVRRNYFLCCPSVIE